MKKKKIATACGKGGTGKMMVAANLAFMLSQTFQVTLVGCDVDAANRALLLNPELIGTES